MNFRAITIPELPRNSFKNNNILARLHIGTSRNLIDIELDFPICREFHVWLNLLLIKHQMLEFGNSPEILFSTLLPAWLTHQLTCIECGWELRRRCEIKNKYYSLEVFRFVRVLRACCKALVLMHNQMMFTRSTEVALVLTRCTVRLARYTCFVFVICKQTKR